MILKNLSHKEDANIAQVGKRSEKIVEFDGVRLSRDLENVLPSELALMDDENFGILFDIKFSENKLFCFEKIDIQNPSENLQKERRKQGLVVLCIDTSSSMIGKREMVAKSVALYMTNTAAKQKTCMLSHKF